MKRTLLLGLILAGCYRGPLAPDYALGTYQGAMIGRGSCPSEAAQLTVTVVKYSAFGDWYPEQQNLRTQFACAWVNQTGFFSSRRPPDGGMEYVIGHFAKDGSALDAEINAGACSYTGRILRASIDNRLNSTSASGQQVGERYRDRLEHDCGDRS
jgi:hypothetical protein